MFAENPQDEQTLYILDLWCKRHINPLSQVINDVCGRIFLLTTWLGREDGKDENIDDTV